MSEKICVCGAKRSAHWAHVPGGAMITVDEAGGLLCGNFREVLEWPDAEGVWWIDCTSCDVEIVHARRDKMNDSIFISVYEGKYFKEQWSAKPHFTKAERNPFKDKP